MYAQTMAEKGFLTVAFDPSYTGESGGQPRYMASPDINTEDFMAAVDFLSVQEDVDPDKIGIIGICGFGGMALNAAALDTRIKATVTSTMYDMTRVAANLIQRTVRKHVLKNARHCAHREPLIIKMEVTPMKGLCRMKRRKARLSFLLTILPTIVTVSVASIPVRKETVMAGM